MLLPSCSPIPLTPLVMAAGLHSCLPIQVHRLPAEPTELVAPGLPSSLWLPGEQPLHGNGIYAPASTRSMQAAHGIMHTVPGEQGREEARGARCAASKHTSEQARTCSTLTARCTHNTAELRHELRGTSICLGQTYMCS